MYRSPQLLLIFVLCTIPAIVSFAHNKVVVIPLDTGEVRTPPPVIERTLLFDASGMAGGAEQASTGRLFPHDSFQGVTLFIKKPRDWNGTSDITLEMMARGLGLGSETFSVEVADFDDGDVIGIGANQFNTTSTNRLFQDVGSNRVFTATIPAQHAQQDWWRISMRRNNAAGTNQSTIILTTVALSYVATSEQ